MDPAEPSGVVDAAALPTPAGGFPLLRSLALVAGLAFAGSAATSSHTVERGETLSEIARRHRVPTSKLASANGITDLNKVLIGQRLAIPAATAAAPAPSAGAAGSHTVRPGETLSHVARRYGLSVRALAEANGIGDIHRVRDGVVLSLPAGGSGGRAAAATGTHTVRPGETLSQIARRLGVSTRALADANGIANVHHVRDGRVLSVPPGAAAPAAAAPAAPSSAASSAPRGLPLRLRQSPERLAYIPTFEHWAAHYGVPVDLLMAMTWLESGWQNHVVSPVGAVGIGQLMPDTTQWMRDVLIREPLDPGKPADNIRMSARYLQWLLHRSGGDPRTALAGYYQGPASVERNGFFGETEVYVTNVLSFRDRHF